MTLVQTTQGDFTQEQLNLIRQTLAPETNDLEFQLFMEVARAQGLNPLQRQIHAVMRWDGRTKRNKMVIQTGIDGYRLIAARTGAHLGTTDATYGPLTEKGYPSWAQVTVKKLVQGHVAEYPATAHWDEYVQTNKEGGPNSMWAQRPRGQLSKCAEALALRKAFPAELSGVYTDVEMQQADSVPVTVQAEPASENHASDLKVAQDRVEVMARRVAGVAGQAAVTDEMKGATLGTVEGCAAAYRALVALGKRAAEPAPAESVGSDIPEPMVTDEQVQLLQAAARSAGATTSENRAAFWAYLHPNLSRPTRTKELTEQQGAYILDQMAGLDVPGRKQAYSEAQREAAGRVL